MMWLTWAIPLVVVVFLWTLNDFLNGRLKELISGILTLFIFAICIGASFVSGWLIGVAALVVALLLANVFRAPVLLIARKLIRYPDLGADEYSKRQLERMMSGFGSEGYFERREQEKQEEERHLRKSVDRALAVKDIRDVLDRHGCSSRDMEAFYQRTEICCLPPPFREVAMCNANMLDFFLQNSVAAEANGEYVRNLNNRSISIELTLWAKHNPNGAER